MHQTAAVSLYRLVNVPNCQKLCCGISSVRGAGRWSSFLIPDPPDRSSLHCMNHQCVEYRMILSYNAVVDQLHDTSVVCVDGGPLASI